MNRYDKDRFSRRAVLKTLGLSAGMLPLIRTFISLPAGVARMPFWRFSLLTLAGCIPWC